MPELEAAVPVFQPDAEAAYRELGKALTYVQQLTELLTRRAIEANRIDDERERALERVAELERRVRELEDELDHPSGK